jgi:hypothetical protein
MPTARIDPQPPRPSWASSNSNVVLTPMHRNAPKDVMESLSPMGQPSAVKDITARQKLLSVLEPARERDDRWTAQSSNAVCA